jgi:hypothetical protein
MPHSKMPSNIVLFKKTAEKLGLTFTKVPTVGSRNLFKIASADRFYMGSFKSPGFYPETCRWHGVFTGNKQLTQNALQELGYKTITSTYLTPQEHPAFSTFLALAEENCHKFPVILKPNNGMDGRGIKYIADTKSLKRELKAFYKNKTSVLLQPIVTESEYRILIINGSVELVHSKDFRCVVGDGTKNIKTLLVEIPDKNKNEDFIKLQYELTGYTKKTVLDKNVAFKYHIVKDSTARHYQFKNFPKDLIRWSKSLTKDLSMQTVAIDLFIDGDMEDSTNYTIIELNSNPGLSHYYTACNDSVQPERICEKVLRDFFKIK